jgi:hypothetical protein
MTKEQEQFHRRMNAEINGALDSLRHEFDVQLSDIDKADKPEWDVMRSTLKSLLFKAYARNHAWIEEGE